MKKNKSLTSEKNTNPSVSRFMEKMEKYRENITVSQESSKAFLVRAGIYTKKGNLKKAFNQ